MENNNRLNYKMRALRLAVGLTQEELAALIGVSNCTVSLYERGLIDTEYTQAISDALHGIKEKLAARYGYWYGPYIELQAALNEITVWTELEGYVPAEVIKTAKDRTVAFQNV